MAKASSNVQLVRKTESSDYCITQRIAPSVTASFRVKSGGKRIMVQSASHTTSKPSTLGVLQSFEPDFDYQGALSPT
jgi:hypothetical protein